MVMTSIMTTDADVLQKAGANTSAGFDDAARTASGLRGESMVNSTVRYNFSDNYATLNIDVRYILSDIVSSFVAIEQIAYDMSGYSSRGEATDMITALWQGMQRNLSVLRDKKVQDFINAA